MKIQFHQWHGAEPRLHQLPPMITHHKNIWTQPPRRHGASWIPITVRGQAGSAEEWENGRGGRATWVRGGRFDPPPHQPSSRRWLDILLQRDLPDQAELHSADFDFDYWHRAPGRAPKPVAPAQLVSGAAEIR